MVAAGPYPLGASASCICEMMRGRPGARGLDRWEAGWEAKTVGQAGCRGPATAGVRLPLAFSHP